MFYFINVISIWKLLGEKLRNDSHRISNLDSSITAHQNEFDALKSRMDEMEMMIKSFHSNPNDTLPLQNDSSEGIRI